MNSADHDRAKNDVDLSLREGEPYRSPHEISEAPTRGLMKSPVTWVLAAGALAGILVTVAMTRKTVQEFGIHRGGAPMDEPYEDDGTAEYETMMVYDSMSATE